MQKNNKQDQRFRSAKPTTIHACAQSGDFAAFQKLLKDNPSLLNDRNPVVRSLLFHFLLLFGFKKTPVRLLVSRHHFYVFSLVILVN